MPDSQNLGKVRKLDYSLLAATIQLLPASRKWTQVERDRWLAALAANVDLMLEVGGAK
jgi:hypothetical protein